MICNVRRRRNGMVGFAVIAVILAVTFAFLLVPSEVSEASVTEEVIYELEYDSSVQTMAGEDDQGPFEIADFRVYHDEEYFWIQIYNSWDWFDLYVLSVSGYSYNFYLDPSNFAQPLWYDFSTMYSLDEPRSYTFTITACYGDSNDYTPVEGVDSLVFDVSVLETIQYRYYTAIGFDVYGGVASSVPGKVEDSRLSETILTDQISLDIPETEPTHSDPSMSFAGWATTSGGSVVYEAGGSVPIDLGAEITLYAVWEKASVTVTFMDRDSVYRTVEVDYGDLVSFPPEPTRSEYVFKGWFIDSACQNRFETDTTMTQDITLYAGWADELEFSTEPSASMNVTKVDGYDRTYLFDASPSAPYSRVVWDFGDGGTSDEMYVTHYYDSPGKYDVTLTVYSGEMSETVTQTVYVDVSEEDGEDFPVLWFVAGVLAIVICALVVWRVVL